MDQQPIHVVQSVDWCHSQAVWQFIVLNACDIGKMPVSNAPLSFHVPSYVTQVKPKQKEKVSKILILTR
jgi:hypothetical protein